LPIRIADQDAADFPAGDESHIQALVNQANCYLQAGREDDALDQYLEAIGFDPDCVEAFYNLPGLFKKRSEYEEALQVFDKLHSISPKSLKAIFEISDCYDKSGLLPQAIECLERIIQLLAKQSRNLAATRWTLETSWE
jgi:tetratricopeptide (TPR) repeat protein